MKHTHYTLSLMTLVATLLLSGCKYEEPQNTYITDQEANNIAGQYLITLNELKQAPYSSEKGNYCDSALYCLRASGKGHTYDSYLDTVWLYTLDTIPTTKPLYIRGRITTDDYQGNFYKSFCIQQIVNGQQQALRISIDAGSIGGMYQIGQEILIRIDGLCIGRYANQPQLCVPTYNNKTYALHADEKVGWYPGRIPFAEFKKRTQLIGLPQTPHCDTLSIADFIDNLNQIDNRLWDGLLVCIKDVHYTGQYSKYGTLSDCKAGNPDYYVDTNNNNSDANVFAPTTGNLGYPQTRVIADANGKTVNVSVSEYAKFARFYLPGANSEGIEHCSDYVGNVTGILGYYRGNNMLSKYKNDQGLEENAPSWDDWSLTIRSLDDLDLYDVEGNLWPRIEYGSEIETE